MQGYKGCDGIAAEDLESTQEKGLPWASRDWKDFLEKKTSKWRPQRVDISQVR